MHKVTSYFFISVQYLMVFAMPTSILHKKDNNIFLSMTNRISKTNILVFQQPCKIYVLPKS